MPIDLTKIDKLLDRYAKQELEFHDHVSNLRFIKSKILHGTSDEKKLIEVASKLTIDSLKEIIEAMSKGY